MLLLFFFFAKRSTFHGLYNCKLKNDITPILEFFSQKKKTKQTKLAQWALASLVQSFSLTSFHHQGSRSLAHKLYFSLFTVSKSALARITCALLASVVQSHTGLQI